MITLKKSLTWKVNESVTIEFKLCRQHDRDSLNGMRKIVVVCRGVNSWRAGSRKQEIVIKRKRRKGRK